MATADSKAEPFAIEIPDARLDDLQDRLARARIPELQNSDWTYGPPGHVISDLLAFWRDDYDWRSREQEMNRFPHFRAVIRGCPIHFMHVRGSGPKPVPLMLLHGWPWSFWDYRKVVAPLADPARYGGNPEDAFDVIVPSLPGYGFSSPFTMVGEPISTAGTILRDLMVETLGYPVFAAHGGDWGSYITQHLGHAYENEILGVHLALAAFIGLPDGRPNDEDYSADESDWAAYTASRLAHSVSHRYVNSNSPDSLAFAMHDSPSGLLAWFVDKRHEWSDSRMGFESLFSKTDLIDTTMIYWLTDTYASSARYYAERRLHPWVPKHTMSPQVRVPTGVTVFPSDVIKQPRSVAQEVTDLRRWTLMPHGGHFGAMEQPDALVSEIRAHFRLLR